MKRNTRKVEFPLYRRGRENELFPLVSANDKSWGKSYVA